MEGIDLILLVFSLGDTEVLILPVMYKHYMDVYIFS